MEWLVHVAWKRVNTYVKGAHKLPIKGLQCCPARFVLSQSTMTSLNNVNYLWCPIPSWSLVRCPLWGVGYLWFHVRSGGRISLVPCPGVGWVGIPYPLGMPSPKDTLSPTSWNHKSGRYASYWNAFLFRRSLGTVWNIDFQIHLWAHQTVFCRAPLKVLGTA